MTPGSDLPPIDPSDSDGNRHSDPTAGYQFSEAFERELAAFSAELAANAKPADQLVRNHQRWCHEQRGRVTFLEGDADIPALESSLDEFFEGLDDLKDSLPDDSALLVKDSRYIQLARIDLGEKDLYVALIELKNMNGEYLVFDGECIENCGQDPAYSQVWIDRRDPDQATDPNLFFSPDALHRKLLELKRLATPEEPEGFHTSEGHGCYLQDAMAVALCAFVNGPEGAIDLRGDDIAINPQSLSTPDDTFVIDCEEHGQFIVKIELERRTGEVRFAFAYDGSNPISD